MCFQEPTPAAAPAPVKPKALVPYPVAGELGAKDFAEYNIARHTGNITADKPITQQSEPYVSAYKLLAKEYNANLQLMNTLRATTFPDDSSNAMKFGVLGNMGQIANVLERKMIALKEAKTAGQVDFAVFVDPELTMHRKALMLTTLPKGADLNDLKDIAFMKDAPVFKKIIENISLYQTPQAVEMITDTKPLGRPGAAAPEPAAAPKAADVPGASGTVGTGASAPANVPPRPAVITFGLAQDMNADYVKRVVSLTSPELKLPEPKIVNDKPEPLTKEQQIALRKRTEAVDNNILNESFFLTTVIDKMSVKGKDLEPQVSAIDISRKGFITALTELHNKYSALKEGSSLADKEALSSEFRTRLAPYGMAADRFKNSATPELALAIGEIRNAQKAVVAESEKEPPKAKTDPVPKGYTDVVGDPAHNRNQKWMLKRGYATVTNARDLKTDEALFDAKGEAIGAAISVSDRNKAAPFLKDIKEEISSLAALPKDKYVEYQDLVKEGDSALNWFLTGGRKFGFRNTQQAFDRIDDKNDWIDAKRKIEYFEKELFETNKATGEKTLKASTTPAEVKEMLDTIAVTVEVCYQDTLYRGQYKGKPNPGAGLPPQGGFGPGMNRPVFVPRGRPGYRPFP